MFPNSLILTVTHDHVKYCQRSVALCCTLRKALLQCRSHGLFRPCRCIYAKVHICAYMRRSSLTTLRSSGALTTPPSILKAVQNRNYVVIRWLSKRWSFGGSPRTSLIIKVAVFPPKPITCLSLDSTLRMLTGFGTAQSIQHGNPAALGRQLQPGPVTCKHS